MIDELGNGVPAVLPDLSWRRSSYSGQLGNCVEIAHLPGGRVAMRDSRDPDGPTLVCGPAEHSAFLASARKW